MVSKQGMQGVKLNIGCAEHHIEAYIGLDIAPGPNVDVVHDLTEMPLPFKRASADEIYCSHVLEHIPLDYQKPLLAEFHRILHRGGRLRIIAPNFAFYAAEIMADSVALEKGGARPGVSNPFQHYEDMMAVLYRRDNWQVPQCDAHYFGFTAEYLVALLKRAGFSPVYDLEDQGPPHVVVEGMKVSTKSCSAKHGGGIRP